MNGKDTNIYIVWSCGCEWQSVRLFYEFLVSKETVVLRRWVRDQNKNLVLSNELIKVELPL